jgi:hypothetical protein
VIAATFPNVAQAGLAAESLFGAILAEDGADKNIRTGKKTNKDIVQGECDACMPQMLLSVQVLADSLRELAEVAGFGLWDGNAGFQAAYIFERGKSCRRGRVYICRDRDLPEAALEAVEVLFIGVGQGTDGDSRR